MSRPRTLPVTTTRRFPFSRLIWFGPSANSNEATWCRGIVGVVPPRPDPGRGIGKFFNASTSLRTASGNRTTIWKRRSPSNTKPASLPPTAVPITSCTADRLRPRRAISALSTLISRKGRPAASSTLTAETSKLVGNVFGFSQPIQMRFNELIAGVRDDLAVKVFGEEFEPMLRVANQIADILRGSEGAADAD